MSKYREHRDKIRREQRRAHVEQQAEQARINAEAEAAGAGGPTVTDERPAEKALTGPAENKAMTARTATKSTAKTATRKRS
jgi:hypothetical protein